MVADGQIIHGIDAASRAFRSIGNNQLIIIKFNGVAAPCALYDGNGGGLCRGEIDSGLAFHLQAAIEYPTFKHPAFELRIEVPLVCSVGKEAFRYGCARTCPKVTGKSLTCLYGSKCQKKRRKNCKTFL